MSFFNYQMRVNSLSQKLLFSLITITTIFSIFTSTNQSINKRKLYKNDLLGNLQYTSKSVFYNPPFPKNNVTGTGDKMEDVPYKALCIILNCETGCCVGELDTLTCGDQTTCNKYKDYQIAGVVAPAVIVPICVILFITLMMVIFIKRNKYSFLKSFLLAFLCIFIVTIPYILYYARKKADNSDIKKIIQNQKDEEEKAKSGGLDKSKEKNDILTINKLDSKNPSYKMDSKKNMENENDYRKIVNEMDDLDEDFKMKEENPVMKKKNESMLSEDMEVDGRYLTDPLRKNGDMDNLISEHNQLMDMNDNNENDENNKDNEENKDSNDEGKQAENNENQEENNENQDENKENQDENKENQEEKNETPEENKEEKSEEKDSAQKEKERISDSLQRIKLLPLLKTSEEAAKRSQLFDRFDLNGNLYLSLSEVDTGVRDILSFHEKFLAKDVIKMAFNAAKKSGAKRSKFSDDYIEKNEFRTFLVFLRQYSEYYEMFELIDQQHDRKISFEEFQVAVPIMQKWGIEIDDPKEAFDSIDTSQGGQIMFDEFCDWAINKNLNLEYDENFDDEELAKLAELHADN